jgi:hypothetical protein
MPPKQILSRVITPGEEMTFSAESPPYAVVFEDDGQTGYFYGLDRRLDEPLLDALHVYDSEPLLEQLETGKAHIDIWVSEDGLAVSLLVNGKDQAFFDFGDKRAMCRTGFPPPERGYTESHEWDEKALHRMSSFDKNGEPL